MQRRQGIGQPAARRWVYCLSSVVVALVLARSLLGEDGGAKLPQGKTLRELSPGVSVVEDAPVPKTPVIEPPPTAPVELPKELPKDLPKQLPIELPDFNFPTILQPPPSPPTAPPPAREIDLRQPLQSPALPFLPKAAPPATSVTPPAPVFAADFRTPIDAPLGFTGRSSVVPSETQIDPRYVPMEDRWRLGFPEWDRYGKGHPLVDDYPYKKGHWWDPYNQNVLKGDYPIAGQNTFFVATGRSQSIAEFRQVQIPTTPLESTVRPFSQPFSGRPNQAALNQYFFLSLDLFHGDAAFRPFDWRLKVTPAFNVNFLANQEVGIVNPNVLSGLDRTRTFVAMQEYFVESKLADLGPNFDFVSVRAGSQPFVSDFRGFLFSDVNLGVRLFGNRNSNREQFNLAYFEQREKDTNSGLNSFNERSQQIVTANYYKQDCVFPGYTAQCSVLYNRDDPTFKFDRNNFLVRPDPVGVFAPHGLDVVYLGWAGDGHINRFNITHQYYWATGHDSRNPMANKAQEISAHFAAVELSYDRDWVRFRTSWLFASGDNNPNNSQACGFDGVLDDPVFAGGEFSYWQRQSIRLFGVNLTNRGSFFNNLRSSKTQGQSNFVNPGMQLLNAGMDFEITPKCRLVTNCNLLWFDEVAVLQTFTFQDKIHRFIGTDISAGVEYRPLLNNNVIINFGVASLLPGRGFHDLYDNIAGPVNPMLAAFIDVGLTY